MKPLYWILIIVGAVAASVIATAMITRRRKEGEIEASTEDAARKVFGAIQAGTIFDPTPIEQGYWDTHGCTGSVVGGNGTPTYNIGTQSGLSAANADATSYCTGDITTL